MNDREPGVARQTKELISDVAALLEAEVQAARDELAGTWRKAGWVAGLVGGAAALLFWVVALLGYTLVMVVAVWLPMWAAALVVFTFFLLVAVVLLLRARHLVGKMDNPIDVVFRRFQAHLEWWKDEVHLRPDDVALEPAAGRPGESDE